MRHDLLFPLAHRYLRRSLLLPPYPLMRHGLLFSLPASRYSHRSLLLHGRISDHLLVVHIGFEQSDLQNCLRRL